MMKSCLRFRSFSLLKAKYTASILEGKQLGIATPLNGYLQLLSRLLRAEMLLKEMQKILFRQGVPWCCLKRLSDLAQDTDIGKGLFAEHILFFQHTSFSEFVAFRG